MYFLEGKSLKTNLLRAWSPQRVDVKCDGLTKMLGLTFDIHGPQRTQAQATKLRLARASAIVCAQRAVNDAVLTASVTPPSSRSGQPATLRNSTPP